MLEALRQFSSGFAAIVKRLSVVEDEHHGAQTSSSGTSRHPASRLLTRQHREATMAQCEVCGNEYDKTFQVIQFGKTHIFDSFECAIHALAPVCAHCGCRVVGHGVEA